MVVLGAAQRTMTDRSGDFDLQKWPIPDHLQKSKIVGREILGLARFLADKNLACTEKHV